MSWPYDDGNRPSSPYGEQPFSDPPPPDLFTTGDFETKAAPLRNKRTSLFMMVGIGVICLVVGLMVFFLFFSSSQRPASAIGLVPATCAPYTLSCMAATITPIPGATITPTVGVGTPTPTPQVVWVPQPTVTSKSQPTSTTSSQATNTTSSQPTNTTAPQATATDQPTATPTSLPTATATPAPVYTTVDDHTIGTGDNQFNYIGAGWTNNAAAQPPGSDYNDSLSYDTTGGDSAVITFTGTQIKIYGTQDTNLGIANYSLDGGITPVNQHASSRQSRVQLFDSGALSNSSHTLTITVTGNGYITIDYAVITS